MDLAAAAINSLVQQSPTCVRTMEKNQLPAYDTFGPFPDETFLAGVDRLLFMLGGERVQRLLQQLPVACVDPCTSEDIIIEQGCCCPPTAKPKCCCVKSKDKKSSSQPLTPVPSNLKMLQTLLGNVASGDAKLPSSIPCKPCAPLKRSFSLCSLACRKLKQVCFQNSKCGAGGDPAPKWAWSRIHCYRDGSEVYEIFKNSCICSHPSQIKVHSTPKIIFVVLPNGTVMPFETLSCH